MMVVLRPIAFVIFVVLAQSASAQAPAAVHVTRLRADDVVLTPADDKSQKPKTVHRDDLHEPWLVKARTSAGDPIVEVGGKRYIVAAVDVVTDEPRKQVVCIDRATPKPGATRGFDECKK